MKKAFIIIVLTLASILFTSCLELLSYKEKTYEVSEVWIVEQVVFRYYWNGKLKTVICSCDEQGWHYPDYSYYEFPTYAFVLYTDGHYAEYPDFLSFKEFLDDPEGHTPGLHTHSDGTSYYISGFERYKIDKSYFYSTWNGGRWDDPEEYYTIYKISSNGNKTIVLNPIDYEDGGVVMFPVNAEQIQWQCEATFKKMKYKELFN